MTRAEVLARLATLPEDAGLDQAIRELQREASRAEEDLPAVVSREHVRGMMDYYPPGRNRLVIRTFYATGMRVSELAEVRAADLRGRCKIFVRSGKGDKDRYVLCDPLTMQMLLEYCAGKGPDFKLFPAHRRLHEIVAEAGAPVAAAYAPRGISPHSLRHSYTTHTYDNGMSPWTLRKLLGHHYLSTTEVYLATSTRRLSAEYVRTHELLRR